MPLFEVAIIEKPTRKEAEEGAIDKLVYGPKPAIAKDNQCAVVVALLGEHRPQVDMNRAEVMVRPFCLAPAKALALTTDKFTIRGIPTGVDWPPVSAHPNEMVLPAGAGPGIVYGPPSGGPSWTYSGHNLTAPANSR